METLHLDLEGGVGERRTTHSTTMSADGTAESSIPGEDVPKRAHAAKSALPTLEVRLESPQDGLVDSEDSAKRFADFSTQKKSKKRVNFHSERPELYEF
jgi:elongator complex protein 4